MMRIKTIDAHVAGEAVRLIVGGGPTVPGRTMVEKFDWLRRHGDGLRRLLMLEPRGHDAMHGAMLTEATSSDADVGVLSMHAGGFPLVSGEGIIAAITIAVETKLIEGFDREIRVDTPVGVFGAYPRTTSSRVTGVTVTGVPSFVHSAGLPLRIGTRSVSVDIAFGGEFYAIADSESIGTSVDMSNTAALIRMGREIKDAIDATVHVQHPMQRRVKDVSGTIFTGVARGAADLRSATVLGGEVLRRSPGVTGTAALLAVLDAMELLSEDRPFAHEGILGTRLHGSVERRHASEPPAVIPVIEGSACITGFHEFVSDQLDSPEAM
jgi:proline racemase